MITRHMFFAGCTALLLISAQAAEIGFEETFALAEDRAEALKQLIPGTETYYYYHCLHHQHTGNREEFKRLMALWIKRYSYTTQVKELLNRQALIDFERNPRQSLDYLIKELNIHFNHSRQIPDRKPTHPTTLDPQRIAFVTLVQRAFKRHKNLQDIEDAGLEHLDHARLDPDRRRHLLSRLRRPDIPNLAKLVVADLQTKHSGGFGSHPIHAMLTQAQLDECLALMPELKATSDFVNSYLRKLAPSDDVLVDYDRDEHRSYLMRLHEFAEQLAPAFDSLKAGILFRILDLDRVQGQYDRARFETYIRYPRNLGYVERSFLQQARKRGLVIDLNANFSSHANLQPIVNDEELVRDYLSHFFVEANDYKELARYIRDDYLKAVFVETKIVNGIGDMEQWYSMMTPDKYKQLKERIDLDFALTNAEQFAPTDSVKLDLYVKNIETLLVKVFEVNTFNFFQGSLREIDTAINLDGLLASDEQVLTYADPPLRRVRRTFEFPQCTKPGVYVIEFIGSGVSSRAVVRKGMLHALHRPGPAGHEFTILDQDNQKRPSATLWLEGRELTPGEDGTVIVPYSTTPGMQTAILRDGDLCSLTTFNHLPETYTLQAGIHVDREALLKERTAQVLLRPVLKLNGQPVSLSLLEDVRLAITSTDREGVASVLDVPDFELSEHAEAVHEFKVPENLSHIQFALRANVPNLTTGKKNDLSASRDFSLNQIDASLHVEDLYFTHTSDGYVIDVLGRNGEIKADRPVNLNIKHRFIREAAHITMQSDESGRITLGPLADIAWLEATTEADISHRWMPARDRVPYPSQLHAAVGSTLRVPALYGPENFTLLEARGGTYVADHSDLLKVTDGFLEISGLSAGDYELHAKRESAHIRIRLTDGVPVDGVLVSKRRALASPNPESLHLQAVDAGRKSVNIQLANTSPFTRVHVFATRFTPDFNAFSALHIPMPEPFHRRLAPAITQYVAGRNIGDEYRYILDRKYAEAFPGNMLTRPALILNPWSLRKTQTSVDTAAEGEEYEEMAPALQRLAEESLAKRQGKGGTTSFSNLDFLENSSLVVANLAPDENGRLTIDRSDLGGHAQLHIVAVDPLHTVYREVALSQPDTALRDLRLRAGLDPNKHFTEQKQISVVRKDEKLTLDDIATSSLEVFDSIDDVYTLFQALSSNAQLNEFNFLLGWPDLEDEKKQELYAKHACHELSFFLAHKDPEFFAAVIRPYLANKKDQTFLDHWLLEADLTPYLEPWAFAQLNTVERILLARRGPGDPDQVGRHLKDRFDLLTPDIDDYVRRFNTALQGRALETADTFGFAGAKIDAIEDLQESISLSSELRMLNGSSSSVRASAMAGADRESMASFNFAEEQLGEQDEEVDSVRFSKTRVATDAASLSYFSRRAKERKLGRGFFRALDKTEEWAENNYYKLPIEQQNAALIPINAFWNDFAAHRAVTPFYSANFVYATSNFAEMMLALAVLDLPFKASEHDTEAKDGAFTIKPGNGTVVFHQEIRPGEADENPLPILITQNFFRPDDRYRFEGNEQFDKFITDEFLARTAFGCRVILTNPTSSRQKLRYLLQIPRGAVPLQNGFYTKGIPLTLEPYATQTFEYFFYFPEPGTYVHYPVQVSRNEAFVAAAPAFTFNVVEKLSQLDTTSWTYVSQNGSDKEVMDYLRTYNVERIDLAQIAWRMIDDKFFRTVTDYLDSRHVFHPVLWSYALKHGITPAAGEFLKHSPMAAQVGLFLDSPLLRVEPISRRTYQHLEYSPLVNARAHQLGKDRKILNDRFAQQYHQFMTVLRYHPNLQPQDRLATAYYLFLQDRIDEALTHFDSLTRDEIDAKMQYDYLAVYAAFYRGQTAEARRIASNYTSYPVPRWQNRFALAIAQLAELKGGATAVVDTEDLAQKQARLAATEPSLTFKVESREILIDYQNLESCRINIYPMDVELLFSRNPFVQQQTEHFSYIRPRETMEVALAADAHTQSVALPQAFHSSNVMIEIVAGGLRSSQAYYANTLAVQVIETYGQVSVRDEQTREPLPATYVKVYARMQDGTEKFYKDGYTDLRGKFDYVSLSTSELDNVARFALLILSDDHGAIIRESAPPKR